MLDAVAEQCHALGVVNEERTVKLMYLVITTRLFPQPVSLIVKGESSAGKSFLTKRVLQLFPDDAYLALTAMTEKALIYSHEPLQHRMLVIYEAAGLQGGFGAYIVRTLLTEGHIKYETANGRIYKPGPTGLIVTTTAGAIHHENETRCLSVSIDDSPEQTKAIMRAVAEANANH